MTVDSLQSLLSMLGSSGGKAPGQWDSTMGGTGWGGLSDATRNSDPLYYGTQTIRDRKGNTTTPDLLAQALKTNPNDIPDDLYNAYVGQNSMGQPQVMVPAGGNGLPSSLSSYAVPSSTSLTGNTTTGGTGSTPQMTSGNDFLSLLKKYMGGMGNTGLMS